MTQGCSQVVVKSIHRQDAKGAKKNDRQAFGPSWLLGVLAVIFFFEGKSE